MSEEKSIDIPDTDKFSLTFRPVWPKWASDMRFSGEPRCVNDISFRFYGADEYLATALPQSSGNNLIRAISSFGARDDWRIGRGGLVNLVRSHFSTNHWSIPKSEDVFFAWLQDLGWKPSLSAPGILAKQIFKRVDGYPQFLKNERLLGLLERMNGGAIKNDDTPIDDNKKFADERALEVGQVKNRLGAIFPERDMHDDLIEKGMFRLGLRVACPNCMRHFWIPVAELNDSLTCPKCLNVATAIDIVDAGKWCYKTAGPFSVPKFADGAYGVLLSINFLMDPTGLGLLVSPVFSFKTEAQGKDELEADFAGFWQEHRFGQAQSGVLFGEAKSFNSFNKKDFDRMSNLRKQFPGAIVVFSTFKRTLKAYEIARLRGIANAGRKYWKAERPINPVLILTGNELFSRFGPPDCWQDPVVKKRFEHARGLLELCDATQQIYLKLPSWRETWRKKWGRSRKRLAASKPAQQKLGEPLPSPPHTDSRS